CMLSDAIATCSGANAGTSTVTTFVESSAGVAAGGKTGFTALVTGIGFILAMFLSPIAQLIPSAATATALIWVGVLMMSTVVNIEWTDPSVALPAFLTIAVMAFGYEISYGIGIGIISSVIVRVCTGKVKTISVVTWVLAAFFLATFVLTH
ncbi:MAG: NCS2 family permease, partial [Clostridia bacterium]|nr:NCS2 family permease [Clostridia bacterium]